MEANKRLIKRTNVVQFEHLVQEMEKSPEIARGGVKFGQTKADTRLFWEQLGSSLNCLGPPQRSTKQWKKVWIDFRAGVRNKHLKNKKKIEETGGRPCELSSFSPLEQAVDAIINSREPVNPVGTADRSTVAAENPTASTSSNDVSCKLEPATLRYHAQSRQNRMLVMLEQQTNAQNNVLKALQRIEKNSYDSKCTLNKIYNLKREKLNLLKLKSGKQMAYLDAKMEKLKKRGK